jgi:protease-4
MSLTADQLIERRRVRRSRAAWRAATILLALAGTVLWLGRGVLTRAEGPYVARLAVEGFIGDDRKLIESIDRLAKEDRAKALLVAIDSPGGSVGGGEALHDALLRLGKDKPVVAVMRGTAASAAYMAAVGTQRIWARDSTVTGSIGVLLQTLDSSELLARLGVRGEALVSGPLKAQPNPFQPLSPEGRAALQSVIMDLYDQFVAMVVAGRKLPEEKVRALADGRVFTGRQALAVGLVDAIGGEREARIWLAAEKQVAENLPVQDVRTCSTVDRWFRSVWQGLIETLVTEGLRVDRLAGLWQLPR